MATISHPTKDFSGPVYIGPTILDFTKGKAATSATLHKATVAALQKAGYKIDAPEAKDEKSSDKG